MASQNILDELTKNLIGENLKLRQQLTDLMEYVEELQVDKSISTNNTATFINSKPKTSVPEISTSIPKFSRAAPRDW